MPEWRQLYVRYKHLKRMLKDIVTRGEEARASPRLQDGSSQGLDEATFTPPRDLARLSLTFTERRPGEKAVDGGGGATGEVTEAAFFEALDDDMDKVRSFVEEGVDRLRERVDALAAEVEKAVRWGVEATCRLGH